jgi:PmbA protein
VILEPHVVCEVLEVLGESLLGESVLKERSLFAGRLGEAVAGAAFTLTDDGTHPGGAATSRFDGEGMARRRTLVIAAGVLQGFLYDRYWAARAGTLSTANSERHGFRAPPLPGASNWVVEPGSDPPEALCRALGDGLLIGELIGVHTADAVSGDFSVGATGRRIRGGVPAEAVAEIAVAGNLLGLLGSVRAVGNDLRFYGSTGSPSLLCTGLEVAGL